MRASPHAVRHGPVAAILLLSLAAIAHPGCAPLLEWAGRYSVVRKPPGDAAGVAYSPPIEAVSTDSTYGFLPTNPVRVGGRSAADGTAGLLRYLGSLAGVHRERVAFRHLGSCCPFPAATGPGGVGLLEIYEITYDGLERPARIYFDLYDPGLPIAPVGFTIRSFDSGIQPGRP